MPPLGRHWFTGGGQGSGKSQKNPDPTWNGRRDAMGVIDSFMSGENRPEEVLGDKPLGQWLLGRLYPGTNPANAGNIEAVGNVEADENAIRTNVHQNIGEVIQIDTTTQNAVTIPNNAQQNIGGVIQNNIHAQNAASNILTMVTLPKKEEESKDNSSGNPKKVKQPKYEEGENAAIRGSRNFKKPQNSPDEEESKQ